MGALIPIPFIPVLLLLFGPPLVLALMVQTVVLAVRASRWRGRLLRIAASYPLTVIGCLALSAVLQLWGPRLLHARELPFAGRLLPVLPLAFVAAAIVVPLVLAWVLRRPRD